jgi:hypothetical protein
LGLSRKNCCTAKTDQILGGNDANPSRQLLDTLQTTLTMYEQRRAALLERARIVAMNAID